MREFTRQAAQLGFVFDGLTGGGHMRYRHVETGAVYTTASTPSDGRSRTNALMGMEKMSGRKLPRKNSGKHKGKRVNAASYEKTSAELASSNRVDRLLTQANRIRLEWDDVIANKGRDAAAKARSLLSSYEEIRLQLEGLHRIIPPLNSVL